VYWQVVLLGVAAAVAVAILGLAVFMPPAPPSPPQLYVKVVPSGGSYLLYVNDSKALREVWYSKNGGPLQRADGPIRVVCGDRVELVAVYEDGSRHSAAAVVKCTKPLRAPSFQVFKAIFYTQQAEYDVVRDASGDSVDYVITVYKCSGAYAWFIVAARSGHGTHGGLPYFARLITRNYVDGTVRIQEYRGVYPLKFGPLEALYDPHTLTPYNVEYILQISTLHPPTFATASGYLAGGPITFKITYKVNATSEAKYFWWYANGTFIGMCSSESGQSTYRTREEAEAPVAAQYHYYYRFESDDTVYRAFVTFYEPKNGTFALEAWHTAVLPTDHDYNSTKNICDFGIVHTRLGKVCTTLHLAVLAGIDYRRGGDYLHDAREVFWALISYNYIPKLRTPQGSVTWRLWNWYKSLPYDEQTKVVKALFYAGETGLEPVRVGSKTYYVDKVFNSTYTVSIVRPNVTTFRVRSVAVPAAVSAVVQGGVPYVLPDWVVLKLGQYSLKISRPPNGTTADLTQINDFLDYWRQWTVLANQSLAGANTPLYYFEPVGAYYVDWP